MDDLWKNQRGGGLIKAMPVLQNPAHDELVSKIMFPNDPHGDRRLIVTLGALEYLLAVSEGSQTMRVVVESMELHIEQLRDRSGHVWSEWSLHGQAYPEWYEQDPGRFEWKSNMAIAPRHPWITKVEEDRLPGSEPGHVQPQDRVFYSDRKALNQLRDIALSSSERTVAFHGAIIEVSMYRRNEPLTSPDTGLVDPTRTMYEVWSIGGRPLPVGTTVERSELARR